MISAILATRNDARRLGETLAALVPAAVDGLVRQVIIADAGSTDRTRKSPTTPARPSSVATCGREWPWRGSAGC